ncbi:lysophospholipid acyltransferase family protein [Deferribacter autotrophicus]|uniref:Lysophospholipid acyltransferase family protein n=1 Tax=Deferribacter autotrophicus TaxID=500465 RepID=A0A5A8F2S3_9BACT|nr:lysophospholipid acyltransferase family protein [Deferribacter autotrophicus]KAA0257764.1 lysophospholipid acyltransferase family protein [Deferribacter autotrophicus]
MEALFKFFQNRDLTTLYRYGNFLGNIAYYVLRGRRRVAERNCEIIGIKDIKKVVKESFKNTFCSFMEIFYLHKVDNEFILNNVIIENEDKIRKLLEKYKSVFVVSAHIGSWEFTPVIFKKVFKINTAIVGRRIKNKKIDDFIKKQRSADGIKYFTHRDVALELSKLVDEGYAIGTLLDHSALSKDSVYVDFFGLKTSFIAGVPLLSLRKKIPILPIFLIREDGYYKMIDYPPIFPERNGNIKENMEKVARKINEVYEDIIRKYPEQWYLIHKRFKRVRDGEETRSVY